MSVLISKNSLLLNSIDVVVLYLYILSLLCFLLFSRDGILRRILDYSEQKSQLR